MGTVEQTRSDWVYQLNGQGIRAFQLSSIIRVSATVRQIHRKCDLPPAAGGAGKDDGTLVLDKTITAASEQEADKQADNAAQTWANWIKGLGW